MESDKIKELERLKGLYNARSIERLKAAFNESEEREKHKAEVNAILAEISSLEEVLPNTDFEIEDTEPFFQDRRTAHPEMGSRWVLVKKANEHVLLRRKYSGDSGGKILVESPARDSNLQLLRALNDRLPNFAEVIITRSQEGLEK